MTAMRTVALLALALPLTLAGCASGVEAEPTSTPTESAPPATTALGLCEVMGEKFLEYPTYVLDISSGDFDASAHTAFLAWAERMEDAAPNDIRTSLARYVDPIYQVQAVVEEGGGALSFSSADFKAGHDEVLEYCADAGFTLDD